MTRPRQTVTVLDTSQLSAHPGNIRDGLGDLTDMACSIREHGILQPLTVTEHPTARPDLGGPPIYRIIDGHRRFKAALMAHETKIPAIIRHDLDDEAEHTILMLVTGIHRRDLSPVERAKGYGRLHDAGLNMTEIARRVGTSPATISYYLNLLRLDETTLEKVETRELPVAEAVAVVREERQAERVQAGDPRRGRPVAHFGLDHPLASVAAQRCRSQTRHRQGYGGVACGPCWEATIRDDAIATQDGAA